MNRFGIDSWNGRSGPIYSQKILWPIYRLPVAVHYFIDRGFKEHILALFLA